MPDFEGVKKPTALETRQIGINVLQETCNDHFNQKLKLINKTKNSDKKVELLVLQTTHQQKCKNEIIDRMQELHSLEAEAKEAAKLVNKRNDQCQTMATFTLAAVMSASAQYDEILKTTAKKSLVEGILIDVIISFLPELKILEKGFGRLVKERIKPQELQDKVKKLVSEDLFNKMVKADYDYMNKTRDKLLEVGRVMDKVVIKDAVRSGKNTVSSNKYSDDVSHLSNIAFQAKNDIFQQAISSIMYKLLSYHINTYKILDTIPYFDLGQIISYVKRVLEVSEMDEINISEEPNLYNKLSDQILYSMLKRYVSQYCSITITAYGVSSGGQVDKSTPIDGLNKSQKQMIYDKFGSKVWAAKPDYPAINDTLDLFRYWGVKVIRQSWDPIRGTRKEKELDIA